MASTVVFSEKWKRKKMINYVGEEYKPEEKTPSPPAVSIFNWKLEMFKLCAFSIGDIKIRNKEKMVILSFYSFQPIIN